MPKVTMVKLLDGVEYPVRCLAFTRVNVERVQNLSDPKVWLGLVEEAVGKEVVDSEAVPWPRSDSEEALNLIRAMTGGF